VDDKGMCFEEMINNRNKSTVQGMSWTSDGQFICLALCRAARRMSSTSNLLIEQNFYIVHSAHV
jgi:hypothetical protein